MGLTAETRSAIADAGLDVDEVVAVVERALAEDLRDGPDVTTLSTVPADQLSRANITPRQPGVLAGGPVAMAVFESVSFTAEFVQLVPDGDNLTPGEPALVVAAHTAAILTAERTALNLLTHLSGIATATRGLGGRRRRHRRARSGTPARRCRACARWRSTRCAAAAASTTG